MNGNMNDESAAAAPLIEPTNSGDQPLRGQHVPAAGPSILHPPPHQQPINPYGYAMNSNGVNDPAYPPFNPVVIWPPAPGDSDVVRPMQILSGQLPSAPPAGLVVPQWSGDVPNDDVSIQGDESEQGEGKLLPAPQRKPSAPPEILGPGYAGTDFDQPFYPPPPPYKPYEGDENQKKERVFDNVAGVSEEEAVELLQQFAYSDCCIANRPVRRGTLQRIQVDHSFHYKLETFTESRSTILTHLPYAGGPISSAQMGRSPLPWDIPANPQLSFKEHNSVIEVPFTSYIMDCHHCQTLKFIRCQNCQGRGKRKCTMCHGKGRKQDRHNGGYKRCSHCGGSGSKQCRHCSGQGQIICPSCEAHGSLRFFVELTVTWKNHVQEHVAGYKRLSDELIKSVSGMTVIDEEAFQVWPVENFCNSEINQVSVRLVKQEASAYTNERQLRQRHSLRIVPVSEAKMIYRDKPFTFWIYGQEKKIHAPDYPCLCCGCCYFCCCCCYHCTII